MIIKAALQHFGLLAFIGFVIKMGMRIGVYHAANVKSLLLLAEGFFIIL